MKFGAYLKNRLYVPWQNYYVNYDLLKKQINNKNDKNFWNIIECELTKVNLFYNHLEKINNKTKDKQQQYTHYYHTYMFYFLHNNSFKKLKI